MGVFTKRHPFHLSLPPETLLTSLDRLPVARWICIRCSCIYNKTAAKLNKHFFLFSHSVITSCRWLCFLASVLALEFCCILLSLWNIHTIIITSLGEEVLMQLENMPRPLSSKTVTQLPQNVLNWTNVDQAM